MEPKEDPPPHTEVCLWWLLCSQLGAFCSLVWISMDGWLNTHVGEWNIALILFPKRRCRCLNTTFGMHGKVLLALARASLPIILLGVFRLGEVIVGQGYSALSFVGSSRVAQISRYLSAHAGCNLHNGFVWAFRYKLIVYANFTDVAST